MTAAVTPVAGPRRDRDPRDRANSDAEVARAGVPDVDATDEEKGHYVFARQMGQNDHYAGFYQTWAKTILFLLGRQHLQWLEGQRRFAADTDVPPWRQQPVTNVTYAVYRTLAAKLTKQKPTLDVVPPSNDSDDRESARLGQSILVHLWRHLKKPAKLRRGIGWYLCTGQVFLRVYWDPQAGKLVPLTQLVEQPHPDPERAALGETVDVECPCDDEGDLILGDDGQPDRDAAPAMVPQGEVGFAIEDPMSVRYNPEATDPDDATEMFVAKLMTREQAKAQFKLDDTEIEAGTDEDRKLYADLLASGAAGSGWSGDANLYGTTLGASQEQALGDRVLVVEYYHDRDPDNGRPEGAHWISVGRRKVWPKADDPDYADRHGEAPLPHGFWPPLVPALSLPIPGQPQAMGALPQVVPLNEQLNTLDGRIMEHEVNMAMGGEWIVHPDDAGLVITSEPAQVLASKGYAQGYPPVQAKHQPLPPEVYAERGVLMDKIRMVMALSEAELGRKPEGVSAGRAFLVLQEVTDSVLGPDLQAWEEALEEVGRRELVLCQQHYREDRSIAIRGERGKYEIRSFTGADLADGLDVRVQVGSSFPWSRAAQQDIKLNILTSFKELVMNPDGTIDQERLAQFLDVGGSGLQSFESDEDEDLVETQREHAMFEAYDPERGVNELPQLALWQSHPKHLESHFRFMKRDRARFDRWNEAAQAAFIAHLKATVQAVDEIAGTLVDANTPGAGEPPGTVPGEDGAPAGPSAAPGGGTMTANERPVLSAADMASAADMGA